MKYYKTFYLQFNIFSENKFWRKIQSHKLNKQKNSLFVLTHKNKLTFIEISNFVTKMILLHGFCYYNYCLDQYIE